MSRRFVLLMILIVVISTAAGVLRAYAQVGVETGDWIKIEYTITGAPSETTVPTWIKVEFLNVEATSANIRVTMHMLDGTEQDETMTVDIVAGSGTGDFSGLVIPANCKTGDSVHVSGYGSIMIDGETTKSYAGARRTVVYASFSQSGTDLTYYWDKQTGVMVGASGVSGTMTATAKATETNMWQAQPLGLPIDPTLFYCLIIAAIAIAATLVIFLIRRKQKSPEQIVPPAPTPPSTQP